MPVSSNVANFTDQILVIPERPDLERDLVAAAWRSGGGEVLPLGRFWDPPALDRSKIRLYGNDAFCLVLAQKFQLHLISPSDDLLVHVDKIWLKREVQLLTLAQATAAQFPRFIKPLVPKVFKAAVYHSDAELLEECKGLQSDTPVIVSEVAHITAEVRAFILDGVAQTCALYEGIGSHKEAEAFVSEFIGANTLPKTCVIDVGHIDGRGWALIEANATWGAGLNGCDPQGAAMCISHATALEA